MENQQMIDSSEQQQPLFEENKNQEYLFLGQQQAADDTSETSSYCSSDNENENLEGNKQKKKKKEQEIDDDKMLQMMEADEFEEPTLSSYAKFKSQNEIDPENIEKYAPKYLILDELDEIVSFGKVQMCIQQATGIILVSPSNPNQIYDLDNIVSTKSKQVVGFIVDVVGPVNQPLYSVQLYPQYVGSKQLQEIKDELMKEEVFLVKKCMKVITSQLPALMNKKGCDASNFYDEELPESDQEFSDDEREREHKKAKKQARANKHFEEGEIPSSKKPNKRKNQNDNRQPPFKRFKEQSYIQNGTQIPMYSANFPITQQPMMQFPQQQPQFTAMPPLPHQIPYQQFQPPYPYQQQIPPFYMQMPYPPPPQQQQQQQQYGYYPPQYYNNQ